MSTVLLDEFGVHVRKHAERLLLEKDGATVGDLLLQDVERIVVCEHAGFSSAALVSCLEHGVEVSFVSRGGVLLGRLVPGDLGPDGELRRAQWRVSQDPDGRRALARLAVTAKIEALRYRVQRWTRREPTVGSVTAELDAAVAQVGRVELDGLLGVEGAATRAYFAAMAAHLKEPWRFERRERRPAPDPVNALLGFCYALVENEVALAAVLAGLDLDSGFLHTVTGRRDSLVLDLLEEFRPLLGDAVALRLLNRQQLSESDFGPGDDGGIWLTERGRGIVFREMEGQLRRTVALRGAAPRSGRDHVREQAVRFARAVREVDAGEAPEAYQPLARSLR